MRHQKDGRKLSRTASHRRALLRNLTTALFEHERIETTLAKAKETRRVAERMITYAKRGDLNSRRLVARVVQDRLIVRKLFDTIAPWYESRPGGYTRILRTRARQGDAGEMAMIELVKTAEQKAAERKRIEEAEKAAEKEAKAKAKKKR
ncbi:MAG: 50S ribosomal protein L17 [Candidatus Eisenbacteria sp.]|nr:50S ribosomal protein L17 [Candidatus Eisenbacteria bacterium]